MIVKLPDWKKRGRYSGEDENPADSDEIQAWIDRGRKPLNSAENGNLIRANGENGAVNPASVASTEAKPRLDHEGSA